MLLRNDVSPWDTEQTSHHFPQENIISSFHHCTGGETTMKEDKLSTLSMDFAVEIISLVKHLKEIRESIISNQIGRSGTSIGANIREAKYAQGTKDFISKMEIALKEASETGYWLELLYKTGYIDEATFHRLDNMCASLRVMLIASCRTAKNRLVTPP